MPVLTSSELREKGNALYKKCQIIEAIAAYKQAAEASPDDALPLANISAAHFEAGDYQSSIESASSALQLTTEEDTGLRENLKLRLTNAYLHEHKPEMAEAILSTLPASHVEYATLSRCKDLIEASHRLYPSIADSTSDIMSKVTRCKPALEVVLEYYVFGHDNVQALYDEGLRENTDINASISLLFAGIGDARNLYETVINMAEQEIISRSQRSFHLVVNDVRPHVLARNFVIWIMLEELSATNNGRDLNPRILNTIFFLYCAPIMPAEAYKKLQQTIVTATKMLEGGNSIPRWILIAEKDHSSIMAVLQSWQTEAAKLYTVGHIIDRNVAAYRSEMLTQELLATREFKLFRNEVDCYMESLMLTPANPILEQDEPALAKLWTRFKKKPGAKISKEIRTYLSAHWKPNVTMLDVDREKTGEYFIDQRPDPWRLPQQLIGSLGNLNRQGRKGDCIFDYVATFFSMTVIAINCLGPRLKIRTTLGDITDIMEEWGAKMPDLPNREAVDSAGVGFPMRFDRIHLSNIPDYVGGSLFSFLYAVPLLKSHPSSFMLSKCLRNPPVWHSLEHFNNEYLVINRSDDLEKLMQTVYAGNWEDPDNKVPQMWPLSDYQKWRTSSSNPHPFDCLLPRPAFNRWLFALFFKLCLPVKRGASIANGINAMVFAPCNLTIYFRLLTHLHISIGYPSHWLSSVLIAILTDDVHTPARPPLTSPLSIAEANAIRPNKHVRTAVYYAEMSTLTTMFMRQLPFAIFARGLFLPALNTIFEYTLKFPTPVPQFDAQYPDFILVFMDIEALMQDGGRRMRPVGWLRGMLQQQESNDLENPRFHVVTTWRWSERPQQATFWMREDVLDAMLAGRWTCEIVRTDDWSTVSTRRGMDEVLVRDVVRMGRCWVEGRRIDSTMQ